MHSIRKIFFHLLYLVIVSVVAFKVKLYFFQEDISLFRLLLTTIFFAIVFGAFLWVDVFSHTYHLYLRYSRKAALKGVVVALAVEIIIAYIITVSFKGFSFDHFELLIVDPLIFFGSFLVMYYWIRQLSLSGQFSNNILWVMNDEVDKKPKYWIYDKYRSKTDLFIDASNITQETLKSFIFKHQVNEVVLYKPAIQDVDFLNLIKFLDQESVGYFVITNSKFWKKKEKFDLKYLERGYTNRDSLLNSSLKRVFDLGFSFLVLGCLLPLMGLIALMIKMEDHGPVFYTSWRVGKNGHKFRFYKFRSMILDAEKKKAELIKFNSRNDGPLFKMQNDPRITKIGKILRHYSLDEIPQLFNVIKGNLSIVGPRPHLDSEVAYYQGLDYQRLDCTPGITCLAQIKGRNSLSFREWIDYDLAYRKHWTFMLDFRILAKTVQVVLAPLLNRFLGKKEATY